MTRIVYYVILAHGEKDGADLISAVLYAISAVTVLYLTNHDRLKGIYSSGLSFIFWLLVALASIPAAIEYSIRFSSDEVSEHLLLLDHLRNIVLK